MKRRTFKVASNTSVDYLSKAIHTNLFHEDELQCYDVVELVFMGRDSAYVAVRAIADVAFIAAREGFIVSSDIQYGNTLAKDSDGDVVTMTCIKAEVYVS